MRKQSVPGPLLLRGRGLGMRLIYITHYFPTSIDNYFGVGGGGGGGGGGGMDTTTTSVSYWL